jgi:hypothetical protein
VIIYIYIFMELCFLCESFVNSVDTETLITDAELQEAIYWEVISS